MGRPSHPSHRLQTTVRGTQGDRRAAATIRSPSQATTHSTHLTKHRIPYLARITATPHPDVGNPLGLVVAVWHSGGDERSWAARWTVGAVSTTDGHDIPYWGWSLAGGQVRLDEAAVRLERRTFQLYQYLVLNPDRVITKEELLREVWGARVLSDGAVSNAVAKLRRALGQRPGSTAPIATVHGLGYRYRPPTSEGTSPREALPTHAKTERAFVGRQRELRVLRRRLEEALQGRGGGLLVTGPSGVGKTRLLQAFIEMARAHGAQVFVGTPDGDGELPQPWKEAAAQYPGSSEPAPLHQNGIETAEAGARASAEGSADGARVFVLDDAQLLNPRASLTLYPWQRAMELRAQLCVMAVRTMDAPSAESGAALLSALRPTTDEINLAGLEPNDVASCLAQAGVADPSLAGALHGQTGGNPRLLWQLLLAQKLEWALQPDDAQTADWLPAVRASLLGPLGALPDATRTLLSAAAVLGPDFDTGTLARVTGEEERGVVSALDRVLQLGVLAPAQVPGRLSFSPPLLRGALYHDLSRGERGAWHGRAADAMRSCSPAERPALLALAEHRLRALPVDAPAVTKTTLGVALELAKSGRHEQAGALLRRALTTLEGTDACPAGRFLLYAELAWAEFHAGHVDPAFHCCGQAFAVYDGRQPDNELLSLAQLLVECVYVGAGDMCRARKMILDLISRSSTVPRRSDHTLACLDAFQHALQQSPTGWSHTPTASATGESQDVSMLHAQSLASARLSRDQGVFVAPPAAIRAANPAADLRQGRRIAMYRFAAHRAAYIRALTRCDITAADQALAGCLEAADAAQAKPAQAIAQMMAIGRVAGAGRIDEAHHMLRQLRSLVGELHAEKLSLATFGLGIQLHERQGRIHDVCAKAEDTFHAVINSSSVFSRGLRIALGRLYALDGQGERSAALLSGLTHHAWFVRAPSTYGDLGLLCWMSETYCLLGDAEGARKVYGRLEPYAHCCAMLPNFGYVGAVAHALGTIDRTLGRSHDAHRNFALAAEQHARLRMPDRLEASRHALNAVSARAGSD